MEDEDIIMPDEDVEIPATEEEGKEVSEQTSEETEQHEGAEEQQVLTDEQVLKYLNGKEIKYNGEKVNIETLDDLVTTYQKGLNYDKVKEKSNSTVFDYVNKKAMSIGITPEEYIKRVESYEQQQEERRREEEIEKLVNRGLDEEVAKRVVEVEAFKEQLKNEKAELEKEKKEAQLQKEKDQEYKDFIAEHPEIKAEDIPVEVWKATEQGIPLRSAYAMYENEILKEKIKKMEQDNKNKSTSVVTPTSEGSSTSQEGKDEFLEGFDSVL